MTSVGVRIVHNATAGFNEAVELNRTAWTLQNVTVADGANWKSTSDPNSVS